MNEDLNEIMSDLSLTQDPQRQQPQPPAPRPDIIDQARGIPAPSDIVEQARVQPGFDTSRPVSVDGPMNAFAAQRMQALLDPQQQGMLPQQPPVRGMEEPPTVDDTRNLIRDMMASDSAALTASFNQVYKTNSDFAARADRMAKFLGMDTATVERNQQEVQQLFDVMDLQSRDLVRNNPALAQDLTNPGFMAIAKDDLDNLSWWTSGANAWEAGLLTAEKGKLGHELKFLDEQGLKSEGEPIRMRIAEINNRLNQLPVASEGFGSYLAPAAQSLALQASFLPRAAATGAVVAGTATAIGGAVSGPLAPIVAPLAGIAGFFKAGGISQTLQSMETYSGLSYLEQLEQGVSPEVAYYTSSVSGVVVGALDKLGFSAAAAPLKKTLGEMTAKELAKALAAPTWAEIGKRYGMEAVKTGAAELTTETAQEFVDILVEDLGRSFTKEELDTRFATEKGRAEIRDRITETFLMTLKGQAILAPTFGSPTLFGGIYQRRAMAEQQKKVLEGIANNAAESKVRKRDPNVYETIVQNQLEQLEQLGGADAKTVYIAPERFLEAMQGVGMTEAELLKLLPDQIESIREAIRNGSDIQIPTAKFASTLGDTNLGRALILDMRLSDNPNVLSAREAEEQGKQLREQLETAAKQVDEDIAADKALEAEIRAVENLFYEQNVRIPNIGKDNAKALSVMQTRMVHTLARESGMPLQQFYEKYRAQFTEAGKPPMFDPQVGAEPAELFDSLGQRKTDTPQFKAWFGDSKVVDKQGQPLVVYHGTKAQFTEFDTTGKFRNKRLGAYFTSSKRYAANYGRKKFGGRVEAVYLRLRNPLDARKKEDYARFKSERNINEEGFTEFAKRTGHDGAITSLGEYVVFDPTSIKSVNNRGTFDPASANIFEQVEKLDADYMAAVERGDMETAQRMVDEAAEAAGYNQEGEHGLALGALAGGQFDPAMRGKNTRAASAELGFFFGSNKTARAYGQKTLRPESAADVSAATQSAFANIFNLVPAGTSKNLDFERDLGASAFAPDAMDEADPDAFIERIYAYANKILDDVEFRADELGNETDVLQAVEQARKQLEASVGMTDFESVTDVATVRVKLRMQNPLVHDQQGQQYRDRTYYDIIREAQAKGNDSVIIKNTYDGGPLDDIKVVFAPEQIKSADPVTRDEQGNIIPLSRRFNLQSPSILEQLEAEPTTNGLALLAGKLDLGLGKRPTVADIARAFQSRVPEVLDWQKGLTDEQRARLVSNISDEVRRAYALHPEAKGWYDENVSLMLSVMRELDPDLAKPDNDFIFKAILAVSSNGNEVSNQFGMTWKTYEKWKQTGVLSDEFITGDRITAIAKHFELINNSIANNGMQATKEFFSKKGTVAEVRRAAVEQLGFSKEEAASLVSSELTDEVVPYASVFGPKLGSFYNNLNGDFSTVTMDRWFMRTLGRLTGTQVEKIPKAVMAAKAAKLRDALDGLSPEDKAALKLGKASWRTNAGLAKVATLIATRYTDKGLRDIAKERKAAGSPQLEAVRLAGNAYKKALDPLVERPTSGGHRRWIRGIMGDVQQQLASTGIELEQADIQALLWYLEKEIYGKLNYRERSKEADYASSAAAQYESVAGQPSAVYAGSAGRVGGLGRSRDVAAEPAQLGQVLEQLGEEAQPRLMAVHNLTADNLRFADGIGGLAVPSVGVVTEEAGEVRGFGEITLIGTKSMIDPAREPVFTSDAYSQRFPRPEWRKPKVKDADALYNQVKDVSKEFGDDLAYYVERHTRQIPDAGELLQRWLNSPSAQALWLRSVGESVAPSMMEVSLRFGLTPATIQQAKSLYSEYNKAYLAAEPRERSSLPEFDRLQKFIIDNYTQTLIDSGVSADLIPQLVEAETGYINLAEAAGNEIRKFERGSQPDVAKNREAIAARIAGRESEFRKWSEEQVLGRFPAPYLTIGRRKVPYTLNNIVEFMTDPTNVAGAEKTMTFGPGMVRAMTSERLESLEQMREAAKTSIVEGAEYDKASKVTEEKLREYRHAVVDYSSGPTWDSLDAAMRALAKFATRKTRTVEQLRKELAKEYYDAAKIPVEALELGVEAAEALLKAPVPYFEAKPQRAVNLNEFAGAVIPQDATQETKDLLTKNGIPFTTYASDTERTAVVRQFTQQLSQQRGDVLSQLANGPNPGFYSALLRSMDAVTAKALPANGWKDQIRGLVNKGTVKQAEVEWSVLNEWLDMQEGKVTKEAVVAFLQGNGVKVETDVLGYNPNVSQKKIDEIDNQLRTIDDILYTDKILQLSKEESSALFDKRDALEAERLAIVSTRSPSKRTKYEVYSLPGGKNYREVLLTLKKLPADDYARFGQAMRDKYGEQYFANMTEAEDAKYKLLYDIRRGFLHQHWQNANVLAHLRMDDRVDADGKKVLFVLEGQSDWGQTGRDEGFISKAMTDKYLKAVDEYFANTERLNQRKLEILQSRGFKTWAEVDDLYTDERVDVYKSVMLEASRDSIYNDLQNNAAKLSLDIEQLRDDINAYVPRGPFVETTKGWVELALKKVMLIAAEGGYDRVAFINGAEAAKQVSASSEVSKIQYNQKTGAFIGYDASGSKVITETVPQEKLTDYVGAELAAKLTSESLRPIVMSRKDYDAKHNLQTSEFAGKDTPWVVVRDEKIIASYKTKEGAQSDLSLSIAIIENIDLVVGDAGMKAFYDKIMPNYLNDLLAKFGKTKSKMVNVEGIGEHLGFDVTPELLDKISEGLPLFSPKQRGTFDPRTLVSAIMSGGKSDTVMHEMWHYYFVMLERFALAGDAPPKLAQDFDTLLAWLKVPGATADERLAAWRNMTFEQRKPYHENTAYAWEIWLAKGEAPSVELEGIFKRMLRWFRETYNDIVTELKALYRQNYGRELILPTSEVEQIFARAVASQEEIDRAMMVRNIQFPYSDAEQAQMRPETLGALKEMWEEMVEEAVINVTGKSISDMQWLSGAETPAMREMQKRHDTLREQMREQVAEQVRMEPIYRAMRHFQTGEMVAEDGTVSNAGSNYKLNSRMTQALLPEGKTLTNLRGMTNRKGLDPSEVAQWYGYPDGKTFVAALANAKPMTEEIKERTDKRMLEEHGDLVNPVQRQRAIERAINNDTRTQFLAAVLRHTDMALRKSVDALSPAAVKQVEQATAKLAELKQTREALRAQLRQAEEAKLAEVIDATNEQLRDNQRAIARERRKISGPITPVRDLVKAAERNADQTLATKKVGEVSSYRYGQQQARASRDAQEAVKKMDLAEVVRAQQKELILHALTKKAAEFEDFVADKLDDYRKFTKDTEKLRKTRDMDLVNVAKAILASYGMGVEVDGIDKRLERFKEANPELYAEFEGLITDAKANARPYRELTVEEFQAVTDAVDRLWYEAKRRLEVGKEGERQALGEVVDLMLDRLVKIGLDAVLPGTTGKETEAEKLAVQVVDMASCVTRIQHWCNKMDELTFGLEAGVFTKNIWRRIQNATSEYLLARDKEIKELADLSKALYTGGPTLYSKHLGYTFGRDRGHSGKAEILGMLLHMGNRDNLERLLTGRQITELGHPDKGKPWGAIDEVTGELDTSRFMAAVQEFIADGTLTQADFDWVQSMWDKIEQVTENYVQPSHKLQTGDYLDLIPPDSFTIRFKDGTVKTYKGGYIPSKIDPAVSSKGRDIENFTELEQDVRQRRPKAADGMTKKRVQGVREPRIMDPMLVVQAIDEELRYSVLGPAINDVLKIANDERLNEAMNRFDRGFIKKTLIPWLNVVATQRITQPPLGGQLSGRVFTGLRTSVAMQALGFNVLNAAQNITGIPTGIYKAGPITYAKAVAEFIYNPKKVIDVIVNSDGIMAERLRLTMFDAETEMKRIFENPSAFNTTMTYVRSSMMILQKVSQNLIDITVWLASYNKAMRSMGADKNNAEAHAEAVRRARETVTLTQYSQRPEDVAKIEVKPAEVRVFTQFFGYINGLAQLAGGEWKKYIRSDLGLPSKAAGLVYIYLLCWLAPSLINDILKRFASDDWEDEDDNGYIDGMFYDVAIKPSMQSVPVVGQVAELAANGFDDKPYNDRLNIAPAVSMVSGAVSEAAKSANKWIRSGELGEEQIYDWITLMGYLTKFPTRPFVKPLEYEAQVEAGKVQPTSSYDYYRGLITGRASPESKQ